MVGRVEIHLQWERYRNLKCKRRGWKIKKKKIIFKIFGPIHHKVLWKLDHKKFVRSKSIYPLCESWVRNIVLNIFTGIWKISVKSLFMQTFLSPNFFHRYSNLIFLDDKYFEDNFCVMTSHIQGCPMIIIQLAFFAWNLKQNSARTGRIC